jgi:hypothetical protein
MSMVTFDPLVLIDEAFERAGYNLSMVTGRQYESALVSLEMALIDIQNYGTYHIHELTETTATQTVTAGQTTLNTSDAMRVINSITATAADGSVRTLQLASLSDLQNYTSSTAAVPTHYAQTGSQPVTVSLWPTPTGDVSLDIKGLKFLVGPDSAFDSVMPVPRLWLDALAASLALNLCRKTPMPARDSSWQATLSMLAQQKEESIERARRETYDRGAITINAGYGSSRRKSRNTTYGSDQSSGTIGPIGPVGPAGPTGPVGPTGETGPAGADGLGWTGVTYDSSTGQLTFTSNDDLGYVTDDLRPSGGGSGISNVVEDLSPQLGGNLDLAGNDITGTGDITLTASSPPGARLTLDGSSFNSQSPATFTDFNGTLTVDAANAQFEVLTFLTQRSASQIDFYTNGGLNRIQWQNNDIWHDGNADAKIDSHLNQSNPTSGHVLSWTGTEYAWVAQSGGGSGTPGGSNTQVQYNNNGSFGGDSTFTFDSATNTLTVQNLTVTGSGATNTISSSSDVVLDAGNRVSVQGAVPFRLPNVTTTQRNAIAGATGDMVFNTTTSAVEVYNGTAWVAL